MKSTIGLTIFLLIISSSVFAETLTSGLQAGKPVPAYQLYDVTGANSGKNTCYT